MSIFRPDHDPDHPPQLPWVFPAVAGTAIVLVVLMALLQRVAG
jgi:hypothetical protein